MTTKKRKVNKKLFDYALIISAVIYLFAAIYNRSIPFKYAIMAFLIIIILMAIGLLLDSKAAKVILSIVILLAAFGIYYIQSSIDSLMNLDDYEVNKISFVVMEDSEYQRIEDLHENSVLAVSENINDNLFESMKQDLEKTYPINGNVISHQDDLTLVNLLYNGEIEVMILDEAFRGFITDDFSDFNTKTRVIYSYEKKDIKDDISRPVDVKNEGFTVYISGIDVDGPISTVARSDVNILMTVNPKTNKILLSTSPRDSYVELGCANGSLPDKLTHAGVYGIECSVSTLENLYDIDINYYAKVNFTSLMRIIDVVGSIEVYSHYDFVGHDNTHFTKGINTLNSAQALEFSRTRKTVPGGDLTRGIHQMEVIQGIINKLIQPSVLLNVNNIVASVSSSVDTNFGGKNLSKLIEKQLSDGKGWEFESMSLTGVGGEDYTYTYPNQKLYVHYPDPASVQEIHNAIEAILNNHMATE